MKKLILLLSLMLLTCQLSVYAAEKIEPQKLNSADTKYYEEVNNSVSILFDKVKTKVKTDKYPKFYHDFTCINSDDTQNPNYYYVKYNNVELIFNKDTNELKFISYKKNECPNCRILYDYPSGELAAIQVYQTKSDIFIFDKNGKYVNYEPYVKIVREKVKKNWKEPDKKRISILLNGKKEVPVQVALTLNDTGFIKNCTIIKSSKIKELDDNATKAIRAAAPFQPFPDTFFNAELVIILDFNFKVK